MMSHNCPRDTTRSSARRNKECGVANSVQNGATADSHVARPEPAKPPATGAVVLAPHTFMHDESE